MQPWRQAAAPVCRLPLQFAEDRHRLYAFERSGESGLPGGRSPTAIADQKELSMTKNPFMSAYLSAANRVANTARGHATNEFKRQSKRQTTSMVNAWVDAWTPKPKAKAKPARKRKSS
jgi:hypothetical protein